MFHNFYVINDTTFLGHENIDIIWIVGIQLYFMTNNITQTIYTLAHINTTIEKVVIKCSCKTPT